jgi:hypothetical protein
MKGLFVIVAVVVGLISSSAQPAPPPEAPWVLLGLDIHMGAVTMRDTAADANTVSVYGEGLPVYQTAAACQAALCQTASNRDPGSASNRDPSPASGQACPGSE